jgi:NADP-dependent 3-hydroxy acid dehydrogenase YdfG
MKDFAGRVAAITGAGSGIGRAPGAYQRATVLGAKAQRRGLARRRGRQS